MEKNDELIKEKCGKQRLQKMQESFNEGQRSSQNCANVPHSLMTRELCLL